MPQALPSLGDDDLALRDAVALGELPVALIVRRYGHDGTGAVAHQHKVGGEDSTGSPVIGCRALSPSR